MKSVVALNLSATRMADKFHLWLMQSGLADFSPIPGTPDGDYCIRWVDLNEPLMHNKTAFAIIMMGFDETNRLKDLQRKLNKTIGADL